ncbi:Sodium/hydrogen exchanger [Spironucleus salmonicida]|uniref:Sodium/hydrogen exchanger n=1 Tax=Spironucleus salmonicida TaxID=348837 RepID=V6LYD5_9EUKA|nr:Sodium/hydrogen exchanger [Spironucleus salmonicida]|eukprot:EST45819.1 Sodium/hydrogen exchanger [Spironucleus salmonicida]
MTEHQAFQVFGFHLSAVSQEVLFLSIYVTCLCLIRVFYSSSKMKVYVPESILLIFIGVIVGLISQFIPGLQSVKSLLEVSPEIILFVFVPIIIFDATYFLNKSAFFQNIREILMYAIVGTVCNAAIIAGFLYALQAISITNFTLAQLLSYASLLSAVDPVSVIAIMEQLHVNENLYIMAFGEATINDGVAIVLYNLTKSIDSLTQGGHSIFSIVGLGIAKFLINVLGAVLTGLVITFLCSFLTKFTYKKQQLEPMLLLISCLLSYVLADALLFSGIIAIMTSALVMSRYVDFNCQVQSIQAFKSFIHALAQTFENLVFLDMGSQLIFVGFSSQKIDFTVAFTLPFIAFLARAVCVIFQTAILNLRRKPLSLQINAQEQVILTWCGLRGAIAFALSKSMAEEMQDKQVANTVQFATSIMITVTILVYGLSMRSLILKMSVKLEQELTVGTQILQSPLNIIQNVIKLSLGKNLKIKRFFKKIDRFTQKCFLKHYLPEELQMDELIQKIKTKQIEDYAFGNDIYVEDINVREKNFFTYQSMKKMSWKKGAPKYGESHGLIEDHQ